ncbi:hypothetical protein HMPREF0179_02397 [Bilophila wadsworthia 3_1_6]|uniref:Glycosyl transferase family 1 domain-containing protein n=1 Tax=Bilophila wadsworthia (strain 3_1_6) TaxID=563192 RepID=E5Y881_BILW3|nr:glycosyltransferase [Bilophila wadsworthia]EFV43791.1 hypothetical protein HMPREF0179_02397 [Bilophila wadsworthia 3_1_6]
MQPGRVLRLLVSDLYLNDAIGNFVLSLADEVPARKIPITVYAERYMEGINLDGQYDDFFREVRPDDIVLYQLSNGDPGFERLMRLPCWRKIVFYHNMTPGHFFRPFSSEIADLLDEGRTSLKLLGLLGSNDAVFANSAYSLSEVLPYLDASVFRAHMPPFTERILKRIQLDEEQEVCAGAGHPYLLTVGRLVPHKNLEGGLALYDRLRQYIPELEYVIMGAGFWPYEKKIKIKAAEYSKKGAHIRFAGQTDNAEASRLFSGAYALLCPSLHEGFCVPIVEAMSRGIPILAFDQPAMWETLGGQGILVSEQASQEQVSLWTEKLSNDRSRHSLVCGQRSRLENLLQCVRTSALWSLMSGEPL